MAGDRFTFITTSDDSRGTVIKSDDQKSKQANGTGVVNGNFQFDSDVTFNEKVNFKIPIGGTPSGSVIAFAGKSAPSGWLMCDGKVYERADYAELASVLGTTFKERPLGEGQSGTSVFYPPTVYFYVPDLRGRVVAGFGDVSGWPGAIGDLDFGDVTGSETYKLTEDEMPKHFHRMRGPNSVSAPQANGGYPSNSGYYGGGTADDRAQEYGTFSTGGGSDSGTTSTGKGEGEPHNNIQPTMALNYIIKI